MPSGAWKPEEWAFVQALLTLDEDGKARNPNQAVRAIRPDLVNPRTKAMRLMRRRHVTDYLERVRRYEVQALCFTRRRLFEEYERLRQECREEATRQRESSADVDEGGKTWVTGNPVPAMRLEAEILAKQGTLLGLDQPVQVEMTVGAVQSGVEAARKALAASVEAVRVKAIDVEVSE